MKVTFASCEGNHSFIKTKSIKLSEAPEVSASNSALSADHPGLRAAGHLAEQ